MWEAAVDSVEDDEENVIGNKCNGEIPERRQPAKNENKFSMTDPQDLLTVVNLRLFWQKSIINATDLDHYREKGRLLLSRLFTDLQLHRFFSHPNVVKSLCADLASRIILHHHKKED